jgi:2-polyprenyl-3-methyl-5-hydroxy-6-metoxy-1,4-benzoquinol methylase
MMQAVPAAALPLARRPCPSCSGGRDQVRLQLDFLPGYPPEMQLVRCQACGTERIDPHPAAAVMADHYDEDYYREGYLPFAEQRRADFRRRLRELERLPAVRLARRERRAPRCLDIGAGVGLFALEAQACGWQVTAVEPSAAARRLAARQWNLELAGEWPAPEPDFDVVTFWDVLGHVDDPGALLTAAGQRLRAGGSLVMKVPNFRSTWHWTRTWMSVRRRVNLLHAPTVIWRFHREGAMRFLARYGFVLEEARTVREPDLIPLTPRWRVVRVITDLLDALLDNRQEMVLYARPR